MSIEKFICDKRVKWRTVCNSDASGNRGLSDRSIDLGSAEVAAAKGACANARRPERDLSNIRLLSIGLLINLYSKRPQRRAVVRFSGDIFNMFAVNDSVVFVKHYDGA